MNCSQFFKALDDDSGEICKPSLCKEDMLGGIAGMTEEEYIRVDSPMYPDFFEVELNRSVYVIPMHNAYIYSL